MLSEAENEQVCIDELLDLLCAEPGLPSLDGHGDETMNLNQPSPKEETNSDEDDDDDEEEESTCDKRSITARDSDVLSLAAASTDSSVQPQQKTRCHRGRQKKAAKLIDDDNRLHVAFSKRKDGVLKKAKELEVLTGCNIILVLQGAQSRAPVKTYAYSSERWKASTLGQGMRTLLNSEHQHRDSQTFEPTETYSVDVLGGEYVQTFTPIVDKLSSSRDVCCSIVHKSMKNCKKEEEALKNFRKTGTLLLEDQEEEAALLHAFANEEEEQQTYIECQLLRSATYNEPAAPEIEQEIARQPRVIQKTKSPRRRSQTSEELVPDLIAREMRFNKRRIGLFKKVFELVALTDCRAIVVAAWSPYSGGPPLKYHTYASPGWRHGQGYREFIKTLESAQKLEYAARNVACTEEQRQVALLDFMQVLGVSGEEFDWALQRASTMDDYLLPRSAVAIEPPMLAQQKRMKKTNVLAAAAKNGSKIKQTTWIKFIWTSQAASALSNQKTIEARHRKQRASDKFRKEMDSAAAVGSSGSTDQEMGLPDTPMRDRHEDEQDAHKGNKKRRKDGHEIPKAASAEEITRLNHTGISTEPPYLYLSESDSKLAYDAIERLLRMNDAAVTARASLNVTTPRLPTISKAPPVPRLLPGGDSVVVSNIRSLSVSTDNVKSTVTKKTTAPRASVMMLM